MPPLESYPPQHTCRLADPSAIEETFTGLHEALFELGKHEAFASPYTLPSRGLIGRSTMDLYAEVGGIDFTVSGSTKPLRAPRLLAHTIELRQPGTVTDTGTSLRVFGDNYAARAAINSGEAIKWRNAYFWPDRAQDRELQPMDREAVLAGLESLDEALAALDAGDATGTGLEERRVVTRQFLDVVARQDLPRIQSFIKGEVRTTEQYHAGESEPAIVSQRSLKLESQAPLGRNTHPFIARYTEGEVATYEDGVPLLPQARVAGHSVALDWGQYMLGITGKVPHVRPAGGPVHDDAAFAPGWRGVKFELYDQQPGLKSNEWTVGRLTHARICGAAVIGFAEGLLADYEQTVDSSEARKA